jgi:voltage-gated potassium channel
MDFYEPSAKQWEQDMVDLRRRLLGALVLILAVTILGIVGFLVIDPDAGFIRAFFMTAITLTTVGYGEEIAIDSDGARIFTAMLILIGMGATLYFVSTGTAFVLEGQLGHVFRRKRMQRELEDLSGHLIVCGSGRTAQYAARELAAVQRAVVLVVGSRDEAEALGSELEDVRVVLGDPTDDDILRIAGVDRASGLIACSESDNQNVVITLTARQLNPRIRVVSKLQDIDQEGKVRKVGANSVVSPQHIGGLRMASELIRPTVVNFLDTMLRDRDRNLRIDEYVVPANSTAVGRPLRDAGLDRVPGVLLLAVRYPDGTWRYNPPRDDVVRVGETLIFLGSPEDARALRDELSSGDAPSPAPMA